MALKRAKNAKIDLARKRSRMPQDRSEQKDVQSTCSAPGRAISPHNALYAGAKNSQKVPFSPGNHKRYQSFISYGDYRIGPSRLK